VMGQVQSSVSSNNHPLFIMQMDDIRLHLFHLCPKCRGHMPKYHILHCALQEYSATRQAIG
jgi:hypothetical protein